MSGRGLSSRIGSCRVGSGRVKPGRVSSGRVVVFPCSYGAESLGEIKAGECLAAHNRRAMIEPVVHAWIALVGQRRHVV